MLLPKILNITFVTVLRQTALGVDTSNGQLLSNKQSVLPYNAKVLGKTALGFDTSKGQLLNHIQSVRLYKTNFKEIISKCILLCDVLTE